MKKIVNGRVYDTDDAHRVLSWSEDSIVSGVKVSVQVRLNRAYCLKDGVDTTDAVKPTSWGSMVFDMEKVDRTRGEFFLSFEAGSWEEESKRIVPVTDEEARKLVEKRGSFDDYCKWFGDPRGPMFTMDAVRKAVDAENRRQYEARREIEKARDAAKARVSELENRVAELERKSGASSGDLF